MKVAFNILIMVVLRIYLVSKITYGPVPSIARFGSEGRASDNEAMPHTGGPSL